MSPLFSMFLSLRKFFGFLVPGFAWVVLFALEYPEDRKALLDPIASLGGDVAVGAVVVIASYFLGGVSTAVAFRLLALLCDLVELIVERINISWMTAAIRWSSAHLGILSATRVSAERRRLWVPDDAREFTNRVSPHYGTIPVWDFYRFSLLERATGLSREVLEVEGEINFVAGMVAPSCVAGLLLLCHGQGWGWLLLAMTFYLILRFQHLRHVETTVVQEAFLVARMAQDKGR